jgi:hypothetical protein
MNPWHALALQLEWGADALLAETPRSRLRPSPAAERPPLSPSPAPAEAESAPLFLFPEEGRGGDEKEEMGALPSRPSTAARSRKRQPSSSSPTAIPKARSC